MSEGTFDGNWMIYGAYGYSGQLVIKEALRRGHRPVLAGRSPAKLLPLAERLDLDAVVLELEDEVALRKTIENMDTVLHAAGPFIHTSGPMVRACLETGTNYLDIAGEVTVFESLLALGRQAIDRGLVVIPGVGFNVLATDCLLQYVIQQVENPIRLEIATSWISDKVSRGTFYTMIDNLPFGTLIRQDGKLVPASVRSGRRRLRFIDRSRQVVPISLGDLSTAYAAHQVPNIRTYTALADGLIRVYAWSEPFYRKLFAISTFRKLAKALAGRGLRDIDDKAKALEPSQAWVQATNDDGIEAQAWLETPDSYHFTAAACVRGVEKVFAGVQAGALTPAQAFGAEFVLEIPGTRRVDRLPAG